MFKSSTLSLIVLCVSGFSSLAMGVDPCVEELVCLGIDSRANLTIGRQIPSEQVELKRSYDMYRLLPDYFAIEITSIDKRGKRHVDLGHRKFNSSLERASALKLTKRLMTSFTDNKLRAIGIAKDNCASAIKAMSRDVKFCD